MKVTSRKAKIVATLGPASSDLETIKKMIDAGLNVARVNMSHGTHESQGALIDLVRRASDEVGIQVAILLDLQGPKIRVDKLENALDLLQGEEWVIGKSADQEHYPEYAGKFIPTTYEHLVKDAEVGCTILFDDGMIEAKAIEKDRDVLKIKIEHGGKLTSNKGINLPDINVSAPSLTPKDEKDLIFGLKKNVDFIALSFVRRAEDIRHVKQILHELKRDIPIVSKIEKPEAIENFREILRLTDLVMIARGDMGVELGNHLVPGVQKKIIGLCNRVGVPVITATQMLESMIQNSRPTRAEASDVANAVWDGSDALMLSGESAAGRFPIKSIQMMDSLIKEAEKNPKVRPLVRDLRIRSTTAIIQVAASMMAEQLRAKWILSVTERGNSCLKMTRFRPKTPVLGVTHSIDVARRMAMYWGIVPYYVENAGYDISNLETHSLNKLKKDDLVQNGDRVVITHGDGKYFKEGSSNSLRIEIIKDLEKVESELVEEKFSKGRILYDPMVCATCRACVKVCPFEIWEPNGQQVKINKDKIEKCLLDMTCVEKCPVNAIEILPG